MTKGITKIDPDEARRLLNADQLDEADVSPKLLRRFTEQYLKGMVNPLGEGAVYQITTQVGDAWGLLPKLPSAAEAKDLLARIEEMIEVHRSYKRMIEVFWRQLAEIE